MSLLLAEYSTTRPDMTANRALLGRGEGGGEWVKHSFHRLRITASRYLEELILPNIRRKMSAPNSLENGA